VNLASINRERSYRNRLIWNSVTRVSDELELGSVLNLIYQDDVALSVIIDVHAGVGVVIARLIDLALKRISIGQAALDESAYRIQCKVIGINGTGSCNLHIPNRCLFFVTSTNNKNAQ
jgi:hypothetical protein